MYIYRVNFYSNVDKDKLICWYGTNNRKEAEALVKQSKLWYSEVLRRHAGRNTYA